MYEAVGLDEPYDEVFFKTADSRFTSIAPTTWRELLNAGYVKAVDVRHSNYRLTGSGWIEGMKIGKQYDSDPVRKRAKQLMAAVKRHVDRENHLDEVVAVSDLAAETTTSVGWCFNALNSGLLCSLFPSKHLETTVKYPVVHVPPTFNHPRR
jgi:hypothetical protein